MNLGRVRVKMCGMTRQEDIIHAVALGIDAIGFIFYPQSPRFVTMKQAQALLKEVPAFVDTVAVLVNPDVDFVKNILEELPIQFLQFHGEEDPLFCEQFNKPFIKAIKCDSKNKIQQGSHDFKEGTLLLDSFSDTARGGTGQVFDWKIIPKTLTKPYILSGGINEINILEAIKYCCPYAVDLCSGIEVSPGVKSHELMSSFMKKIKGKEAIK